MTKLCSALAVLAGMLIGPGWLVHPSGHPASAPVVAGSAPAQAQAQGGESPAAAVAAARKLLAAGRTEEAIGRLNAVLARSPAHHDAATLKTSTLLGQERFDEALSTYDGYTAALKKPDLSVLSLIARADLQRMLQQRQSDPAMLAGVLERLARDGDTEALETLRRRASAERLAPRDALALNVSLARLGDRDAAARLGELLASAPSDGKTQIIRIIQEAGATSLAPRVAALLGDSRPEVRSAAALAVGVLQYVEAVPRLQALFRDDVAVVQMFAAVALKRLGQSSADSYLAQWLKNGVPEVRLSVAEAYQTSKSTQWTAPIRELLTDRNELNRLRAAEMLAGSDQVAARSALLAALNSPTPALRAEAARILEAKGLADAAAARRLLGDPHENVRLCGAGATLRLAAAPSR